MGIKKDKNQSEAVTLRRRATDRLKGSAPKERPPWTEHERQRLLHELDVHQIELEMQNEELRRSRDELEMSRSKYAELYDFAPVGYFTFDAAGVIQEVNFSGAQLLGIERGLLVKKPFVSFISDAGGREVFLTHLTCVLQRKVTLRCEIKLTVHDGLEISAQLQSAAVTPGNGAPCIFTSIIDTSVRNQFENELQKAHDNMESLVIERTKELTKTNLQLNDEIAVRKSAEDSLQAAYAKIRQLQDRLQAENIYLQEELSKEYNFGEIIGQSDAITKVFLRVEQVAPMNATVLLLGETGVGKGMVARAIHLRSVRKNRPMITVNCTALPANLIESELFGRERGAFTGADARQIGRFELADGGTIFLDEIGEMPMDLQCKLLRVIQDGDFERLGSPRTIKVNVRIIAASNRNLEGEVKNGRFREDLFYRLNVFPITIPPLRQRKDDIPLLVNHFIAKYNKKSGKKINSVPRETLSALQEYYWPGNVRELENVIERALITSQGSMLQVLDRFETFRQRETSEQEIKPLVELEQNHILQVLQQTGWRIEGSKGAALILGLNPSTLRARMRKYGIQRQ